MSTVLLKGIVGSTAYGLATLDSDQDFLGVYAVPTERLFLKSRLTESDESTVTKNPDCTLHEVRKFCALAEKGNPSVLELLWLDGYTVEHPLGRRLVACRDMFLSRKAVRGAYLGYASEQLRRIRQPRNEELVNATRARQGLQPETEEEYLGKLAKHGRHVARLLFQALDLDLLGRLRVRLDPWEATHVRSLGEAAAAGSTRGLQELMASAEAVFNRNDVNSALPSGSDSYGIDTLLTAIRLELLTAQLP